MMKILVLDELERLTQWVADARQKCDDVEIVSQDVNGTPPTAPSAVDILVADGPSLHSVSFRERFLSWRTHLDTHLIPCWVSSDALQFHGRCLWPRLSIDVVREMKSADELNVWVKEVSEWQQSRSIIADQGTLAARSPLELANALALRKASGVLRVFGRKDLEGMLAFKNGCLADARVKHFSGAEAFFELLCWTEGDYLWAPEAAVEGSLDPQPLLHLVGEGLRLVQDANLLFHFAEDLHQKIDRTTSESALDDGAIAHFASIKEIYTLINGKVSIAEVLDASPISSPRTMSCLAKWFSMGDICVVAEAKAAPACRVLIVDDSPFMCKALSAALSKDPTISVLGEAHDGIEALKLIDELDPDVVTLDLQMPRMDGLTALKHIMIRNAKPVVVLSAFTPQTSPLTYQSFKLGAVDVLTKPSQKSDQSLQMEQEELRRHIIEAGAVRIEAAQYIRPRKSGSQGAIEPSQSPDSSTPRQEPAEAAAVVLSGVGGFAALIRFLLSIRRTELPCALLACLDMPSRVVEALLPNIEKDSALTVEPIRVGQVLASGKCYLGSREQHWTLQRTAEGITAGTVQNGNRGQNPFDHLLAAASDCFGSETLALLLSGNGTDGVAGMNIVKKKGGRILALSPDACLKPDLPRRVIAECGAQEIRSTAEMARVIEQIH